VEPRDHRADVNQADHLHHAEPQRPAQARLRAEDRRLGAGGRLEGPARLRQQDAPGVRELDFARGPLEQPGAQLTLEGAD
jgi:hypothetical protein